MEFVYETIALEWKFYDGNIMNFNADLMQTDECNYSSHQNNVYSYHGSYQYLISFQDTPAALQVICAASGWTGVLRSPMWVMDTIDSISPSGQYAYQENIKHVPATNLHTCLSLYRVPWTIMTEHFSESFVSHWIINWLKLLVEYCIRAVKFIHLNAVCLNIH